ncbi:hypothetical protein HPB48_017341 [Haemaphysalis longicornis]|uniref:Uncharacterized protein n=1 Tax=Haemaphysalis longicornis TaxID=44386 RepID=A0A9J6GYK3_HAELO|nr:hypothetical protein HPB48_017341 [Haemaphysalis longicornis]
MFQISFPDSAAAPVGASYSSSTLAAMPPGASDLLESRRARPPGQAVATESASNLCYAVLQQPYDSGPEETGVGSGRGSRLFPWATETATTSQIAMSCVGVHGSPHERLPRQHLDDPPSNKSCYTSHAVGTGQSENLLTTSLPQYAMRPIQASREDHRVFRLCSRHGSGGELSAQRHGYRVRRGGANKCGFPHQPQQRQQHENRRPASKIVKVFLACLYHSSAVRIAGRRRAATRAVYWWHHFEGAHVMQRSSANDALVIQKARSFATGRTARQTRSFTRTRQVAVICADEGEDSCEMKDQTSGYGEQNMTPLHAFKGLHNRDGDAVIPYEDEVPSTGAPGTRVPE